MNYQDNFHLSDAVLREVLDSALSRGGDFSEIYLEYKIFNLINMEEDIIKETAQSISMGMGIRVISGEKTGFGYTSSLEPPEIKKAALSAAAVTSSPSRRRDPAFKVSVSPLNQEVSSFIRPAHKQPLEDKIALVKKVYCGAQEFHPSIKKVKAAVMDQIQYIKIVNSEGLSICDTRPLTKLTCSAIAESSSHNQREFGFSGGGGRVGMEYFEKTLPPQKIGRSAAQEAVTLLEAAPPPAGEMPVVLAPGHSGVLIHEAVGHLLEADFNRKKTSIFWDKMGKKVGNEQVNIYDDPTIPFFRGSYNIDDEGTVPHKTPLIREGRVVGLLQDRLSAQIMNQALTGHGRRQDYSCIPIPRMSNSYIDKGTYSPEEIIKSVERGFYAQHFQGGQVEDSGKFTFSVSSGYLIEKGKLTAPVKQATLIGSNIDILQKIEMIGTDLKFGLQTGTCGKDGQAAPVTDGCPTLKIIKMTVGGQN